MMGGTKFTIGLPRGGGITIRVVGLPSFIKKGRDRGMGISATRQGGSRVHQDSKLVFETNPAEGGVWRIREKG